MPGFSFIHWLQMMAKHTHTHKIHRFYSFFLKWNIFLFFHLVHCWSTKLILLLPLFIANYKNLSRLLFQIHFIILILPTANSLFPFAPFIECKQLADEHLSKYRTGANIALEQNLSWIWWKKFVDEFFRSFTEFVSGIPDHNSHHGVSYFIFIDNYRSSLSSRSKIWISRNRWIVFIQFQWRVVRFSREIIKVCHLE